MATPVTYKGNGIIQIMSTDEFNGLAHTVLEYMAQNDGPGGIYDTSEGGVDLTFIGSFTDTTYVGNVGSSDITVLETEFNLYQDLRAPEGDDPPKALTYTSTTKPLQIMTNQQMDAMADSILQYCVIEEGPHSFQLAQSVPADEGTWTTIGTLSDSLNSDVSTTFNLYKKLSSGIESTVKPLKRLENGILQKFTDQDVELIAKLVRQRIVDTGIGQYVFQQDPPPEGTWVNKGTITDNINTLSGEIFESSFGGVESYTEEDVIVSYTTLENIGTGYVGPDRFPTITEFSTSYLNDSNIEDFGYVNAFAGSFTFYDRVTYEGDFYTGLTFFTTTTYTGGTRYLGPTGAFFGPPLTVNYVGPATAYTLDTVATEYQGPAISYTKLEYTGRQWYEGDIYSISYESFNLLGFGAIYTGDYDSNPNYGALVFDNQVGYEAEANAYTGPEPSVPVSPVSAFVVYQSQYVVGQLRYQSDTNIYSGEIAYTIDEANYILERGDFYVQNEAIFTLASYAGPGGSYSIQYTGFDTRIYEGTKLFTVYDTSDNVIFNDQNYTSDFEYYVNSYAVQMYTGIVSGYYDTNTYTGATAYLGPTGLYLHATLISNYVGPVNIYLAEIYYTEEDNTLYTTVLDYTGERYYTLEIDYTSYTSADTAEYEAGINYLLIDYVGPGGTFGSVTYQQETYQSYATYDNAEIYNGPGIYNFRSYEVEKDYTGTYLTSYSQYNIFLNFVGIYEETYSGVETYDASTPIYTRNITTFENLGEYVGGGNPEVFTQSALHNLFYSQTLYYTGPQVYTDETNLPETYYTADIYTDSIGTEYTAIYTSSYANSTNWANRTLLGVSYVGPSTNYTGDYASFIGGYYNSGAYTGNAQFYQGQYVGNELYFDVFARDVVYVASGGVYTGTVLAGYARPSSVFWLSLVPVAFTANDLGFAGTSENQITYTSGEFAGELLYEGFTALAGVPLDYTSVINQFFVGIANYIGPPNDETFYQQQFLPYVGPLGTFSGPLVYTSTPYYTGDYTGGYTGATATYNIYVEENASYTNLPYLQQAIYTSSTRYFTDYSSSVQYVGESVIYYAGFTLPLYYTQQPEFSRAYDGPSSFGIPEAFETGFNIIYVRSPSAIYTGDIVYLGTYTSPLEYTRGTPYTVTYYTLASYSTYNLDFEGAPTYFEEINFNGYASVVVYVQNLYLNQYVVDQYYTGDRTYQMVYTTGDISLYQGPSSYTGVTKYVGDAAFIIYYNSTIDYQNQYLGSFARSYDSGLNLQTSYAGASELYTQQNYETFYDGTLGFTFYSAAFYAGPGGSYGEEYQGLIDRVLLYEGTYFTGVAYTGAPLGFGTGFRDYLRPYVIEVFGGIYTADEAYLGIGGGIVPSPTNFISLRYTFFYQGPTGALYDVFYDARAEVLYTNENYTNEYLSGTVLSYAGPGGYYTRETYTALFGTYTTEEAFDNILQYVQNIYTTNYTQDLYYGRGVTYTGSNALLFSAPEGTNQLYTAMLTSYLGASEVYLGFGFHNDAILYLGITPEGFNRAYTNSAFGVDLPIYTGNYTTDDLGPGYVGPAPDTVENYTLGGVYVNVGSSALIGTTGSTSNYVSDLPQEYSGLGSNLYEVEKDFIGEYTLALVGEGEITVSSKTLWRRVA